MKQTLTLRTTLSYQDHSSMVVMQIHLYYYWYNKSL
jgi:hypothetical protein